MSTLATVTVQRSTTNDTLFVLAAAMPHQGDPELADDPEVFFLTHEDLLALQAQVNAALAS